MSIICDFELPPIEECGCVESSRVKTKHKGLFQYKGVKCLTDDDRFIHRFVSNSGHIMDVFTDSEYIEGLEEGKEIELEYEL